MRAVALSILAVCAAAGSALAAPPPRALSAAGAPTKLAANPLEAPFRFGAQSVVLEKTPLQAIARRTGAAVGTSGEAPQTLSWVCLTDVAGRARVWFTSSETGGGLVNGLILSRFNGEPDEACPALPARWSPAVLPRGLGLGMTSSAITEAFGAPQRLRRGVVAYAFEQSKVVKQKRSTLSVSVRARLAGGVVTGLEMRQSTTAN